MGELFIFVAGLFISFVLMILKFAVIPDFAWLWVAMPTLVALIIVGLIHGCDIID
jgi:riboflavin transporter FmnP